MTQYVAVKFRIADTRTYTYEYSGEEPLFEGDQVKVADARTGGEKRVYVVSISDEKPPFACKPIIGKVDPEPDASAELADAFAPSSTADPLNSPIAF